MHKNKILWEIVYSISNIGTSIWWEEWIFSNEPYNSSEWSIRTIYLTLNTTTTIKNIGWQLKYLNVYTSKVWYYVIVHVIMHSCKKGYIDILLLETKDGHCLILNIFFAVIPDKNITIDKRSKANCGYWIIISHWSTGNLCNMI